MSSRYSQSVNVSSQTRFTAGVAGSPERSRQLAFPEHITTFNAGDIVPIYYAEVLPSDTFKIDLSFVIRQVTAKVPVMGSMDVTFYAFFVPNRIVNQSAASVFGENVYDSWTANPVTFAPLFVAGTAESRQEVEVPIGSVADYYGFPTQQPIPASVLEQCNDLKFRGYVEIYNQYFRDQNYQPPIPYSKLNVYEGFFEDNNTAIGLVGPVLEGDNNFDVINDTVKADNTFGAGAVQQAIYGSNLLKDSDGEQTTLEESQISTRSTTFSALGSPLKANKLRDYFTSVLPSPQKGSPVFVPVSGLGARVPVFAGSQRMTLAQLQDRGVTRSYFSGLPVNQFNQIDAAATFLSSSQSAGTSPDRQVTGNVTINNSVSSGGAALTPTNLQFDSSDLQDLSISINDLRMAASIQQVYEQLARTGSRYRSYVNAFFGLDVEDAFKDIPEFLGKFSRKLELYQTAQTSATEGNNFQGDLAAFGYTSSAGTLFHRTFNEHGYLHIFAVVRHRNIYSSMLSRDNFRLSMLDFYHPQLANISEQPVFVREINPFASDPEQPFGYQEPWFEYRSEPDRVSGYMRTGINQSLSVWNYADSFDSSLSVATGSWLESNSQQVLDRSLEVQSSVAPQLKGQFTFRVEKERPMPVFGVPGMDVI